MNKLCKLLAAVLIGLSPLLCTLTAMALEKLDPNRPVSLSILYASSQTPIREASFSLYKVADVVESGPFQLDEAFRDSQAVLPETEDPSKWDQSAASLMSYAAKSQISPTYQAKTDSQGKAQFYSIEQGLYLVSVNPVCQNDQLYSAAPFLVCLPSRTQEGVWTYDVTAWPKGVITEPVQDLEIIKQWDPKAPVASIEATLYQDGQKYETFTLSEKNGWKKTFEGLDGTKTWTVSENTKLDGWNLSTTQKKGQILLTNVKKENKTTGTIPFSGSWTWLGWLFGLAGMILLGFAGILNWRQKHHG
ncbi:MAG: hypothetical protein HUJ55_00290 [Ileibacterium sp.]|nr:hypothetical protein [Ileibacterium sp.]